MERLKIQIELRNPSRLETSPESEMKANFVESEQDTRLEMFIIDQRINGVFAQPPKINK